MPNIATVLRTEIARLARKEVRAETEPLKKSNARLRSEIASLRRQLADTQRLVKSASRRREVGPTGPAEDSGPGRRFSAKGLASHRQRLGLSAEAMGALVGVTAQSIYKWESGKARPRASQMDAIAELRAMGKRQVRARLDALAQG